MPDIDNDHNLTHFLKKLAPEEFTLAEEGLVPKDLRTFEETYGKEEILAAVKKHGELCVKNLASLLKNTIPSDLPVEYLAQLAQLSPETLKSKIHKIDPNNMSESARNWVNKNLPLEREKSNPDIENLYSRNLPEWLNSNMGGTTPTSEQSSFATKFFNLLGKTFEEKMPAFVFNTMLSVGERLFREEHTKLSKKEPELQPAPETRFTYTPASLSATFNRFAPSYISTLTNTAQSVSTSLLNKMYSAKETVASYLPATSWQNQQQQAEKQRQERRELLTKLARGQDVPDLPVREDVVNVNSVPEAYRDGLPQPRNEEDQKNDKALFVGIVPDSEGKLAKTKIEFPSWSKQSESFQSKFAAYFNLSVEKREPIKIEKPQIKTVDETKANHNQKPKHGR